MYRIAMAVLAFVAGSAFAGDIYRWTDENGRVHYGSRPGGTDAREIAVKERPPAEPSAIADQAQRRDRERRLLQTYERDRALKREQEQRESEERKKVARVCRELNKEWSWLNHPGPIYTDGEAGKRNYLDEAARQEQKDKVREQMDRHCR